MVVPSRPRSRTSAAVAARIRSRDGSGDRGASWWRAADFARRRDQYIELLEVGDIVSKPVRNLSLGERMKVELLAALLHRPRVLFLDEPTLGLDVNAQAAMRDFLREYNQRYGASVLLTSHYMADIVALCERVIVIHKGELGYDGSLDQLTQRLSPFRELQVELKEAPVGHSFNELGEVTSVDGHMVRFKVPRAELTRTVGRVLESLDVVDLKVSEPPVETIIAQVFKEGVLGEEPRDDERVRARELEPKDVSP